MNKKDAADARKLAERFSLEELNRLIITCERKIGLQSAVFVSMALLLAWAPIISDKLNATVPFWSWFIIVPALATLLFVAVIALPRRLNSWELLQLARYFKSRVVNDE